MITGYYSKSEASHPGRIPLLIIWSAGVVCAAFLWIFFTGPEYHTGNTGYSLNTGNTNGKQEIIDELLVSSDEIKQAGQKTFVNIALRFQWNKNDAAMNSDNERKVFYNNILKARLEKIQKKEPVDFSIKPVPK